MRRLLGVGAAACGAAAVLVPGAPAAPASRLPAARARVLSDLPTRQAPTQRRRSSGPLIYHGGPVLHANHTQLVFWQPKGSGLRFDPGYIRLVETFLRNVAAASHRTSNLFALTGQYTDYTARPAAYASRYRGGLLDTDRLPANGCAEPPATGPGWTVCLSDRQLQSELEHFVRVHRLPTGADDVYLLVTPRGFGSCLGTTPSSGCALGGRLNGYCGYHSVTSDGLLRYAVIPFNAVAGHCQSGNPRPNHSAADPALSTISHELSETITDPDGDAWTSSSGYESGDLCATDYGAPLGGSGSTAYDEIIHGGHYYLQEEWSNAAGSCQPRAQPDRASFSVTRLSGRTRRISLQAQAHDPEGRIVAYRWSFGDGRSGSGRTVAHRYRRAGSYAVTLRVTDSWKNWRFSTRRIEVR